MSEPDERRVVTAPMVFTTENGEQDRWQPGDQFEVLRLCGEHVWVERGPFTGWVNMADLRTCSTAIPPSNTLVERADFHGTQHPDR